MFMKKIILAILLLTTIRTTQAYPENPKFLRCLKKILRISNHPSKCILYNEIINSFSRNSFSEEEKIFLLSFTNIFNNTDWRGEENIKILTEEDKEEILELKNDLDKSYENIHNFLDLFLITNTIPPDDEEDLEFEVQ